MPRLHDYIQSSGFKTVTTDQPRFGFNEIDGEQLEKEFEIFPPGFGRNYQFSRSWSLPINVFQAEMEEVFEWLSNNSTGPWSWHEEWGNQGHSLEIHLHIERQSDQTAFNKTWGHAFEYSPDNHSDLDKLAVLRGVLPPKKELLSWLSEHGLQFELNYFETETSGEKNRKLLIAVDSPEKAKLFQAEWGHLFKPYIKGIVSDAVSSGARFLEKHNNNQIFIGDLYFEPDRAIPGDFREYVQGHCDFSAVRTISLETSPAGLPNVDFTCK